MPPEKSSYRLYRLIQEITVFRKERPGIVMEEHLVVHPAILDDPAEEWRVNMDMYKALAPILKENNVVCCLENLILTKRGKVYEAVCADPYEACDYIDELNDFAGEKRFAFCLDTGHAMLTGRDIYTAIMKLGGRIETLHIHDNDGSVIIAQRPCALLKYVKYTGRAVVTDRCRKCKMCMKLGCPAISLKDGAVKIDPNQCNGCGLCVNVCPFGAIEKEAEA